MWLPWDLEAAPPTMSTANNSTNSHLWGSNLRDSSMFLQRRSRPGLIYRRWSTRGRLVEQGWSGSIGTMLSSRGFV